MTKPKSPWSRPRGREIDSASVGRRKAQFPAPHSQFSIFSHGKDFRSSAPCVSKKPGGKGYRSDKELPIKEATNEIGSFGHFALPVLRGRVRPGGRPEPAPRRRR